MKDLTVGKEGKLILMFALPMLLGNVFQQLYIFVDSIVVGNYLSKGALTAVGASFPIFFALISLGIGLATGAGVVISQYFGAKQYLNVQKAIDTMYIILLSSSIIIGVIGILFIDEILAIAKLPDGITPSAKIYLTILLAGLIFDFGYNGTAAIFRSIGDSKTPLYFLIIATLTNIILEITSMHPSLPVVLSGGVFQNKLLLQKVMKSLDKMGRRYYIQQETPINDGSISLGQVYYAMKNLKENNE